MVAGVDKVIGDRAAGSLKPLSNKMAVLQDIHCFWFSTAIINALAVVGKMHQDGALWHGISVGFGHTTSLQALPSEKQRISEPLDFKLQVIELTDIIGKFAAEVVKAADFCNRQRCDSKLQQVVKIDVAVCGSTASYLAQTLTRDQHDDDS
jgi:hypothetical protein